MKANISPALALEQSARPCSRSCAGRSVWVSLVSDCLSPRCLCVHLRGSLLAWGGTDPGPPARPVSRIASVPASLRPSVTAPCGTARQCARPAALQPLLSSSAESGCRGARPTVHSERGDAAEAPPRRPPVAPGRPAHRPWAGRLSLLVRKAHVCIGLSEVGCFLSAALPGAVLTPDPAA